MLSLLCVLAVSATATSVALASPEWWVAGKLLVGKAALAEKTNVTKPLITEISEATLECKKVTIKEGFIESPNKRNEKAEIFDECTLGSLSKKCSVAAIETKPLKATLEKVGGAIKLKFEPQTGTEIGTVEIGNNGVEKCPATIVGARVLRGTMVCDYPGVETESTEHALEFTPESGSEVTWFGTTALFSGTDKVLLASGGNWSVK